MKKLKHNKKDSERLTLIKVKPTQKFIWECIVYNAGQTLIIPSISVNENIHKIIKEV